MALFRAKQGTEDPESDAFWTAARARFIGATAAVVRESFLSGIESMPSAFDPGFIDAETLRITRDYTDEWWARLETSTRRTLRQAIITWQTSGLGPRGLPDLIDAIAPLFGRKRAEAIAVTEVTRLFAEGAFANMRSQPAIQQWTWQTAEDERVEGICIANADGSPYPMGGGPSFPAHVRCLPGDALVSSVDRIAAVSERWYEGEIIVISTAAGDELPITPNHPVLTPRGWVAAKLLQPGDGVFRCCLGQRMAPSLNPHDQQVPTRIEEIARALRCDPGMTASRMPITAEDFHGDGRDGEVDIVWADRELRRDADAQLAKMVSQRDFQGRHLMAVPTAERVADPLGVGHLTPPRGGMGSARLLLAPFRGHLAPLEVLGFGLAPGSDIALQEDATDGAAGNAEVFGKSVLRLPGQVERADIDRLERQYFRGHVYNLETDGGWYTGNNIIVHNCRCLPVPVVP